MIQSGWRHNENSMLKVDKENSTGPLTKTAFGSSVGPSKPQSQQATSRRPFGNITNAKAAANAPSEAKEKKASTAAPRRALGDITNAGPAKATSGSKGAQEPVKFSTPALTRSRKAQAVVAQTQSRAEQYAEAYGVERPAGKGWVQLEAERQQEEDNRISHKVQQFSASATMPSALWSAAPASSAKVSHAHGAAHAKRVCSV